MAGVRKGRRAGYAAAMPLRLRQLRFVAASLALAGVVSLPLPRGATAGTPPAAGIVLPTPVALPLALRAEVIDAMPHDPRAFTQGLLWHSGLLLESTGLNGRSSLREVDPKSGQVRRRVDLAREYFGEGLALVEGRLFQLTWQNGVAFVYDLLSFSKVEHFEYAGEGWGLCYDGRDLVMSDGSSSLAFRDPGTFAVRRKLEVRRQGKPVSRLNELECVGDRIYANIWMTDEIVVIDPNSGAVTAAIDASGLLTPAERAASDVLNGIAYDEDRGDFLITGKLWPKVFRVRFVPR